MQIAKGNFGRTSSVVFVVATALFACSTGTGGGAKTAESTLRSREIVHEPCDVDSNSAERIDANNDGKPDITIVRDGGKERCRATDLDFDGRVDLYSYFDVAGQLTRRELDYDRDGAIDEIQLFKAGIIAEKQRASTLAKRLDTWETYLGGRLIKAERDADGNGRIDQWWDYQSIDCPVISTDTDGNGLPDPTSRVDFCSEATTKPPEQATPTTAPVFQKDTQALPTETSNTTETESENTAKASDSTVSKSGADSIGTSTSARPTNGAKGQPNEK